MTTPIQQQPATPPTDKKMNVLALIAMIVAIVGFIFACIPGALIVGWILLPIAFILSIVSLFLKGDKKWFGVVGLIVSIVGTIVGFIVFFATLANAINDAFPDTETVITEPDEADTEPVDEDSNDAAAVGTRDNPAPIGSTIEGDDWTVTINSFNPDAADLVAANSINDPAPEGSHHVAVNYTVVYTGDEKGLSAEVGLALVTSTGEVINSYDNIIILEDGFGMDELYNGGTATGTEAFTIPDGTEVLIRVTPGMFADETFIQP